MGIFKKKQKPNPNELKDIVLPGQKPYWEGVNVAQEIVEPEPENSKDKETDNVQIYMISWKSRFGSFNQDTKRVAKAFIRESEADEFVKKLKEAAAFLQYTEDLKIRKEIQQ